MFHGFLHGFGSGRGESASSEILSLRLLAANYTLILTPRAGSHGMAGKPPRKGRNGKNGNGKMEKSWMTLEMMDLKHETYGKLGSE